MSSDHQEEIVHRELDVDHESPAIQVAEIVAELEGKRPTEVATIWECIDDVLARLFSNPPDDEAQLEVTFSYEGYRVTVEQNGVATFVQPR